MDWFLYYFQLCEINIITTISQVEKQAQGNLEAFFSLQR